MNKITAFLYFGHFDFLVHVRVATDSQ